MASCRPPQPRDTPLTTHASFTASDGTRLAYALDDFTDPWKKAPWVILIHPGMGSSERLFAWVPHFARNYKVVRPDVRGHGKSEPGTGKPLTLERIGRDLKELMDHLGIDKAHVMGSSAGGMVAMQCAFRWPERFQSMSLFAATAGIHPDRPKKGNWLERAGKHGVRHFLNDTVKDRIGEASAEHVKWFLDSAEGITVEYLAQFVPLMASEYFPERLAEYNFPVQMVVPVPDPMVEAGQYEEMRKHLKKCTYVEIPGAGHGMSAEIPDRCAAEFRKFIEAVGN